MDFLNWTFISVGICLSLIGIHFEIFQYLNKRGRPKPLVITKALIWGSIESTVIYALGLVFWIETKSDSEKQILVNTELVLDCSAAMEQPFDGESKVNAAKEVIQKILSQEVAENDNLAFRKFGGPCEGKNNWLAVKFSINNESRILKTLQNIKAFGESTLIDAIIEAIGDFNDIRRFRGVNKTIIVITGSGDSCVPNPEKAISKRLEDRKVNEDKIEISFRFIGIEVPIDQRKNLSEIAMATGGDSETFFVTTRKELENVLRKVISGDSVLVVVDSLKQALLLHDFITMIKSKIFFDSQWNSSGEGVENRLVLKIITNDRIVIDYATSLSWQQSGSKQIMTYDEAKIYVTELNKKYFGGFHDWRLPTLEEALSLMEPVEGKNGLYIDSIFDRRQDDVWTEDKSHLFEWSVWYSRGTCNYNTKINTKSKYYARAVRQTLSNK